VIFAKGERIREHGLRLVLRFALQILRLRGLNMEKENPRKETEFVSEEDTSSFRMK